LKADSSVRESPPPIRAWSVVQIYLGLLFLAAPAGAWTITWEQPTPAPAACAAAGTCSPDDGVATKYRPTIDGVVGPTFRASEVTPGETPGQFKKDVDYDRAKLIRLQAGNDGGWSGSSNRYKTPTPSKPGPPKLM